MKKVRMLVLGGLLLAPAAARSQTVHGVVVDDGTKVPIASAMVELLAPDATIAATTQTNGSGAFLLKTDRTGNFTVRLTHVSYMSVESDTLEVGRGETVEVELRMASTVIPLEPLVVTARGNASLNGFYERMRRPGFGRFLTRADIETRPGARSTDLLRGIPGVEIVPVRRGLSAVSTHLITMRGGPGTCMPTIYIDGMVVKQLADSGVDDLLTPDMLEGVEIYTGYASAPSPLNALDSCGVVAFWTRSDARGTWSVKKLLAGAGAFLLLVVLVR